MKRFLVLMFVAMLCCAVPSFAAEKSIGYVDLQKALNLTEAGKAAKQRIANKVKDFESQLEQRQNALKALKDKLEKKELLLTPEARKENEREYQQKLKDFQRDSKDFQDEVQQLDADYTREILQGLFAIVAKVSEREGYSMVLEKTESSILYAAEETDLTDKVIAEHNAEFAKNNAK